MDPKRYVLEFSRIDKTSLPLVGGKGANLGEMTQAGFPVPQGFCISTDGFMSFIHASSQMTEFYRRLEILEMDDLDALSQLGQAIREHLCSLEIPEEVRIGIIQAWRELGEMDAYAVRSSATAEDLPGASFAGQQETYLNIIGEEAVLENVRLCWASLFTDRAIAYRSKNGFEHRKVALSVVVQKMIFPEVSGILFTADPVSGNRNVLTINASYGLGEALVSGIVSADLYKVKHDQMIEKNLGEKKIGIYGLPEGGTEQREIAPHNVKAQALTDDQIIRLARLGREIERHYGSPQDIEWALANDELYIVQSRPVTSLYPAPQAVEPEFLHVFFSFGHQQMMTNALKPLAISVLRTFFPFGKENNAAESKLMQEAGGRLFIDVTYLLHTKIGRRIMPQGIKNIDDRISLALIDLLERPDFQMSLRKHPQVEKTIHSFLRRIIFRIGKTMLFKDLQTVLPIVNSYIKRSTDLSLEKIRPVKGAERIHNIRELLGSFPIDLFNTIFYYPLTGLVASKVLETLLNKWLRNAAELDDLSKAFHGNITTEMGLDLGDLADKARLYPEIIYILRQIPDSPGKFYEELENAEGGPEFLKQLEGFLQKYGMRCPGEIDITQPRWKDDPRPLMPAILSHIDSSAPKEHRKRFAEGEREAHEAIERVLTKVNKTMGGYLKQRLLARLIKVYRKTMVLREHPKYLIIKQFDICRQAIMEEAERLWHQGIISDITDVYFLSLEELENIIADLQRNPIRRDNSLEANNSEEILKKDLASTKLELSKLKQLITERRESYEYNLKLNPPRVITSEGEILTGMRRLSELPQGALPGQPVSAGVVEGRARVIIKPGEGKLEKGEILIAPFTDPGWTPLFISASGLVMEVGGLMTHGAVVAREYGIPAVVGVDAATTKIQTGQRVRLNGYLGYVEIIEEATD